MLRPNPIMQLYGDAPFDAEDVAANSRAQLSMGQRRRFQRERAFILGAWVSVLGVWVLMAEALRLRPWLAVVGAAGAVVGLLVTTLRYHDDLQGPVLAAEGVAWVKPLSLSRSRLQLGADEFGLPRSWRRVIAPGTMYRVYYSAGSRMLLSAEFVQAPQRAFTRRHVTGRLG